MEDDIRLEGREGFGCGFGTAICRQDLDLDRQRGSAWMAVVVNDEDLGLSCNQHLDGVRPDEAGATRHGYAGSVKRHRPRQLVGLAAGVIRGQLEFVPPVKMYVGE